MRMLLPSLVFLGALALLAGCDTDTTRTTPPASEPSGTSVKPVERPTEVVMDEEAGEPKGLHNHRRWSERIGQGAQPKGEVAFRNLAALGYKVVLNVDGALPNLEMAAKYGLRYVHIPLGYDGIPREAAAKIVKAVTSAEGPVYIHCHHGRHRGPAACMLARQQHDAVDHETALEGLKISRTSPKYEGLWRDVGSFETFAAEALAKIDPASIPESVKPAGIVAAMVDTNLRWEHLMASKKHDWGLLPESPDVSPPHEARMLWESFREQQRLDESKALGKQYMDWLAESEAAAIDLELALRADNHELADKAYERIRVTCNACHVEHRNND